MLAGAEFEVTSPSGLKETIVIGNDGFGQSSIYSAEEVRKGNFKVVETKAPKGYVLDATPFEVTVGQAGVVRTVKNTKIKTEIPVEKKWEDGNNRDGKRPTSITVQLMADGQEVAGQTKELNEGNGWKANFTNLDKYKDGVEINYTVKEVTVPAGYTSTVQKAGANVTVTNTYTPEVTQLDIEKVWDDANNKDNKRPTSITVQLMADGQEVAGQTQELNEGNSWKASFTNLDKYKDSVEINYTVKEVTVPTGYTSTVQKAGTTATVTNTYTPEVTQLDVEKVWDDANNKDNKRPTSITVQLMADDQEVADQTQELNEGNGWKASFTNLDKYKDGVEINYIVKEVTVPAGYTSTVQKTGTAVTVKIPIHQREPLRPQPQRLLQQPLKKPQLQQRLKNQVQLQPLQKRLQLLRKQQLQKKQLQLLKSQQQQLQKKQRLLLKHRLQLLQLKQQFQKYQLQPLQQEKFFLRLVRSQDFGHLSLVLYS
ncbi:TPA: Cna B-type domain-containing protein [Streptococcus suis]|nr:Cna B-type domain-containing protein [Streptococcus suis]HEL2602392.1 Cna B-type domain-containing protein [Streptococcus suis]